MELVKSILVPIDFSDYSKNALKYAASFAKHFEAKMYLVYIVEPTVYPADFSMGQVAIPSLDVDLVTERLRVLCEQVILDRYHFSPGEIDGLAGSTRRKMIALMEELFGKVLQKSGMFSYHQRV